MKENIYFNKIVRSIAIGLMLLYPMVINAETTDSLDYNELNIEVNKAIFVISGEMMTDIASGELTTAIMDLSAKTTMHVIENVPFPKYVSTEKLVSAFRKAKVVDMNFVSGQKATVNTYIWLITDTMINIIKYVVDDEAKNLLISTIYGNAQALTNYLIGNKGDAAIGWAVTNYQAFKGSIEGSVALYKEHTIVDDNTMNAEVLILKGEYRKKYAKAFSDYQRGIEAYSFTTECRYTYGGKVKHGFFLDKNEKVEVKNICNKYLNDIITYNKYKLGYLLTRRYLVDKDNYEEYVKDYFPISEHAKLMKVYDYNNLDIKTGIHNNTAIVKYLHKMYAHGWENLKYFYEDSAIFDPDLTMTNQKGLGDLIIAGQDILDGDINQIYSLYIQDEHQTMSRLNMAKYLLAVYKLDSKFTENQKKRLESISNLAIQNGVGWYYEALVLRELKIISPKQDFKPFDNITIFEFLVMVSNTLDYLKCNRVGCNIYELMLGEKIQ